MAAWGLNTYFYAPKDDLKHRALWRERYSTAEADELRQLIEACRTRSLHFIYGLSPGLDIHYSRSADLDQILTRFEQMLSLGCRDFALLFDDIPGRLEGDDRSSDGTAPASAQCHVANAVFTWIREREPQAASRSARRRIAAAWSRRGSAGRTTWPSSDASCCRTSTSCGPGPTSSRGRSPWRTSRSCGACFGRKPLIWDNLHANDYDGRRFFCGPYSGRPLELRTRGERAAQQSEQRAAVELRPAAHAGRVRALSDNAWDARVAYLLGDGGVAAVLRNHRPSRLLSRT